MGTLMLKRNYIHKAKAEFLRYQLCYTWLFTGMTFSLWYMLLFLNGKFDIWQKFGLKLGYLIFTSGYIMLQDKSSDNSHLSLGNLKWERNLTERLTDVAGNLFVLFEMLEMDCLFAMAYFTTLFLEMFYSMPFMPRHSCLPRSRSRSSYFDDTQDSLLEVIDTLQWRLLLIFIGREIIKDPTNPSQVLPMLCKLLGDWFSDFLQQGIKGTDTKIDKKTMKIDQKRQKHFVKRLNHILDARFKHLKGKADIMESIRDELKYMTANDKEDEPDTEEEVEQEPECKKRRVGDEPDTEKEGEAE